MYAVVEAVEARREDERYFIGLCVGQSSVREVGEEGGTGLDHGVVYSIIERPIETGCEAREVMTI